jgi:hypothetical protein
LRRVRALRNKKKPAPERSGRFDDSQLSGSQGGPLLSIGAHTPITTTRTISAHVGEIADTSMFKAVDLFMTSIYSTPKSGRVKMFFGGRRFVAARRAVQNLKT